MPQASSAESTKSNKASKAAKAILHPKSTLAAAKANSSRPGSAESTSAPEAAKPTQSPASSIRKMPSNASIASNTAKPLPSVPSSTGSPATTTSSLPTAAPSPSVLAPPISADILSMNKQAIDRTKPAQQTTASTPAAKSTAATSAPTASATPSNTVPAVPYAIDDSSVLAQKVAQAKAASPAKKVASVETSQATSIPAGNAVTNIVSESSGPENTKDSATFAAEVAEALASTAPTTSTKSVTEETVATTPVAVDIVAKAVEPSQPPAQPIPDPSSASHVAAASAPTQDASATIATATAKVSNFIPPELTRVQHNTFVSRPTDPSRAAIRDVDPSVLPVPLRPLDKQNEIVQSPSHVVIFGWMDAPIRLVAKYAQPYTVLFPDATVLIQLSDGKSYLARENIRREQLQHVINEITSAVDDVDDKTATTVEPKDVGDSTVTLIDHSEARSASSDDGKDESPKAQGFVIHSFSDGGAGNLALFLDEMARRSGPSPRVHSLVMDSSPGKSNPRTGSVAFTMHLANRPRVRAIVQFFVYIGLYLMKIWTKLTGQPARGELMRKRLNSLRSWNWVTASYKPKSEATIGSESASGSYPPRMYMYTKADQLIPWQFVEEHADNLASIRKMHPGLVQMENASERETLLSAVKGNTQQSANKYEVELRRWDRPPHCSIGRADFEGYWAAVMDFYTNVLSRQ